LRALEFGDDLGLGRNHADWVLEAHFDSLTDLRSFFENPVQKRVTAEINSLTQSDRSASIQHRMLSG
jgi:hypothetical protein